MVKYIIFGNGWIGNKFHDYLINAGETSILSKNRIEYSEIIKQINYLINEYNPEIIINCIGKTGRPNIDWCELHKEDTFFSNVTIPSLMAETCKIANKYMIHIGSGCVFEGDNVYTEKDIPNFIGSFYSRTKIYSEEILKWYDNVLQLRIRMPIDNRPSQRNLITKLVNYKKVIGDIPNSVTYIPDFLDISKQLIDIKETGIYNIVNNGSITHRELLQQYKSIVDPNYEMPEFITENQLRDITVADRSNCTMSTIKLYQKGIKIRNIKDALEECMEEYRNWI